MTESPVTTAEAPPREDRRHRRTTRLALGIVLGLVIILVIAIIAGTSYVATVSKSVSDNLQRSEELPPEIPVDPTEAPRPTQPSAKKARRSTMCCWAPTASPRLEPGPQRRVDGPARCRDRKSAALISFPRDLYVSIPGNGKNKINAAFAFGGTPLTVRTLEGLLDTRMDHVALIDFAGFIALTDELGGVTVNNPHASVSQGFVFRSGPSTSPGKRPWPTSASASSCRVATWTGPSGNGWSPRPCWRKASASRPCCTRPSSTALSADWLEQVKVDDGADRGGATQDRNVGPHEARQHRLVAGPDQGNRNFAGWVRASWSLMPRR